MSVALDSLPQPDGGALAFAAAEAVAAVLPASEPLSTGDAQPGTEHVTALFAGAAIADLGGAVSGRIAVLVGEELVNALAASPMGGLDLAAAVQPSLDAAAAALGGTASAGRSVEMELVLDELASGTPGAGFVAVPLIGSGIVAAVLVPDQVLTVAQNALAAAAAPAAPIPVVETPGLPDLSAQAVGAFDNVRSLDGRRGIEMLHGVELEVTVELGRTRMPVRELLALAPGAVIALDRAAGSPADLLVNGRLIARGEVVVVDEDFGLRVTEIVDSSALG